MSQQYSEWELWAFPLRKKLDSLTQRTEISERASEQIAQINEQTKNLAASGDHLQDENNALRNSISQLEQDASDRDRVNLDVQRGLRTQISILDREFRSVIDAVGRLQGISKTERERQGREMQRLRAQVEGLLSSGDAHAGRTGDGRFPKIFVTDAVGGIDGTLSASRALSQATTADESMQNGRNPGGQQSSAAEQGTVVQSVSIADQGSEPLDEYVGYVERVLVEALKELEAKTVNAFVRGLRKSSSRLSLLKRLENEGDLTWPDAKQEALKGLGRRKRSRQSMEAS